MHDLYAHLNELLKQRQALGLNSRMPGGIWKNKDLFLIHYNPDLDISGQQR